MARRSRSIEDTLRRRTPAGVPMRDATSLEKRKLLILACEGLKTERHYFESWFEKLRIERKISPRSCIIAPHDHTHPTGVLSDLLAYRECGISCDDFEHKWIVIDRDEERTNGGGHTAQDFNKALDQAKSKGVHVAYTNPCFEFWYLLHYEFRDSSLHRDSLASLLGQRMGIAYDKSDRSHFGRLLPKVSVAIRNAEKLCQHEQRPPCDANPSTTVHQLVILLKKMLGPPP